MGEPIRLGEGDWTFQSMLDRGLTYEGERVEHFEFELENGMRISLDFTTRKVCMKIPELDSAGLADLFIQVRNAIKDARPGAENVRIEFVVPPASEGGLPVELGNEQAGQIRKSEDE